MNIKNVFIFLLGAATGAGGMYLVLEKRKKAEIEKKVTEAVAKNSKKTETPPENVIDISESAEKFTSFVKDTVEEVLDKVVQDEKDPDIMKKYSDAVQKMEYNKISKSEPVTTMTDVAKEEAKETINKAVKKVNKKVKVPKKVTQDEFDATPENERKQLYFYADEVLADIETNDKYDPVETMGATNFKNFKSTYDTVYICNYADNMMYEITFSNSKYSEIVGGDIDE